MCQILSGARHRCGWYEAISQPASEPEETFLDWNLWAVTHSSCAERLPLKQEIINIPKDDRCIFINQVQDMGNGQVGVQIQTINSPPYSHGWITEPPFEVNISCGQVKIAATKNCKTTSKSCETTSKSCKTTTRRKKMTTKSHVLLFMVSCSYFLFRRDAGPFTYLCPRTPLSHNPSMHTASCHKPYQHTESCKTCSN